MYAHGFDEMRSRIRPSNFRTKICEDLARGHHRCSYVMSAENRCNFAHPGDALRVNMGKDYFDEEYEELLFVHREEYPRGIYL